MPYICDLMTTLCTWCWHCTAHADTDLLLLMTVLHPCLWFHHELLTGYMDRLDHVSMLCSEHVLVMAVEQWHHVLHAGHQCSSGMVSVILVQVGIRSSSSSRGTAPTTSHQYRAQPCISQFFNFLSFSVFVKISGFFGKTQKIQKTLKNPKI